DGDFRTRGLHPGNDVALFDTFAASHGDIGHLPDLRRCKQHILTLDIADGKWLRSGRTGGKQRGGKWHGTEDSHCAALPLASRIAFRFLIAVCAMARVWAGPVSFHPIRRITASWPIRK